MGFILSLVCMALCIVVYVRMINREVPEKLTRKKAVIPCLLGFFSIIISTAFVMAFGLLAGKLVGKPLSDLSSNLVGKSPIRSFLTAGFPEELAKLLVALLSAVIAIIVIIGSAVLQFVLLAKFKKSAEKLCEMELRPQGQTAAC